MSEPREGMSEEVESLASRLHTIYQTEAKRQGDVRHHDEYANLPENIKEFDRVLARFIIAREARFVAIEQAAREVVVVFRELRNNDYGARFSARHCERLDTLAAMLEKTTTP